MASVYLTPSIFFKNNIFISLESAFDTQLFEFILLKFITS